jgi:ribosome modulation factor
VTTYNPNTLTGEDQRAYQAGYQNGLSDAQNNRAMNISTDNWHGDRLPIYQQGYQDGYRSVAPPAR